MTTVYSGTVAGLFPGNCREATAPSGQPYTLLRLDVAWKDGKDKEKAKDQAKTSMRKADDKVFTRIMQERVDRLYAQSPTGVLYPVPGRKSVKPQPEDAALFRATAHEAVKDAMHKDFPSYDLARIEDLIRGYVHSSRNRLLQDKASEELKQQCATKGQNWNNRYKQYQDKNLVPDGAEFKLYSPKAKALGTTKAAAASASAAAAAATPARATAGSGGPAFTPQSVPPVTVSGAAGQQQQHAAVAQQQQAAAVQQQQPAMTPQQQPVAVQQQQGNAGFSDPFGDDLTNHPQNAVVIMMRTGNIAGAQKLLAQIAARQAEKGQQPQDTQGMGVLAAAAAAATLDQDKKKKRERGKKGRYELSGWCSRASRSALPVYGPAHIRL
ncbi:hypothetical protein OEZ85_007389 [Tetradesmus obliquus]|uniref:Uncharacterized protein n=1 Tax=Tetradesmus obliquus TaxID=3088 RepID=A0ABY8TG00_TETOB|nr:hypothetical protein OEZ85_007389 [Tetradesmus obliquus]